MKKKMIILLIVGILIIGCGVFGFVFYNSKKLKIEYKNHITLNVNDEFYNTDAIKKIQNGTLLTKKVKIDTAKVTDSMYHLKIKNYFNRTKKIEIKYEVVDKEPPVITFNPKITIEEGTEYDLLTGVSATDNCDELVIVVIEGTYDINTPGTYELEYMARDSYANEAREKFTLEVTKKVVVEQPKEGYKAPDRDFTTSNGHHGTVRDGITYIDGIMIANKTYPLPSSYNPGDILGYVWEAFTEMKNAAAAEGIYFDLASGFRSYNYQKNLYNRYVAQDGKAEADTYSARPGHSEHQTGLAMDVGKVDRNYGNEPGGIWLAANAYKYGFILRYPYGKTGETGYIYEPWHFRYVGKELAPKLYNGGDWITLETYFGITSEYTY